MHDTKSFHQLWKRKIERFETIPSRTIEGEDYLDRIQLSSFLQPMVNYFN